MVRLLTTMAVKIFFLLAFATVNSEVVSAFGWSTTKGLPSGCAEACTNLQVTAIAIPDYAFDDMSKVDVNSKLKNPLDVIVTINQMPTCNKIATSKLVNSCHFPQDKHSTFESISNYYAANLAICELHDAGVNYPTSCDLFAPPADMPTKLSVDELFSSDKLDNQAFSFQSFSASTKHLADKCVKALSSKAQWWTSFSNNKQNAYQICYAYRSDIERDALMATVAAMASKTNDLDMKLFASISSAQQMLDILFSLRQESAGTSEAVSELLDALTKSLETAHVKLTDDTRKGMLALVEYQEDTINKFAESRNALQEVALEVTRIWQDMQIAGLSVSQLSLNLDKLVTDVDMASLAIQASAANASSNLAFISTHIDNISGPITTASTWINGLTGSWLWKLGTDSEAMAKISQSALHATACFCLAVPLIHHDTSFGILGSVVTSFGCSLFIFGWAMGAQDFTRDSWVSLASAFAAGAALVEYLRRALRSDGWVVGLGRSVLGWW